MGGFFLPWIWVWRRSQKGWPTSLLAVVAKFPLLSKWTTYFNIRELRGITAGTSPSVTFKTEIIFQNFEYHILFRFFFAVPLPACAGNHRHESYCNRDIYHSEMIHWCVSKIRCPCAQLRGNWNNTQRILTARCFREKDSPGVTFFSVLWRHLPVLMSARWAHPYLFLPNYGVISTVCWGCRPHRDANRTETAFYDTGTLGVGLNLHK